jgi:hypothetical protein
MVMVDSGDSGWWSENEVLCVRKSCFGEKVKKWLKIEGQTH